MKQAIYILNNSASSDVALFLSTLVALHRYLPLSATVAVFSVKLLLTPLLCVVTCVTPEVCDFLSFSHVIFIVELLPLEKQSNITLTALSMNWFCGCFQNNGKPTTTQINAIL